MPINYANDTQASSSARYCHPDIQGRALYKRKTKIVAFASNATKPRCILFHCHKIVCTVTYNAWLSSIAETHVTERLPEDLDVQPLRTKYITGQVHATIAHRVPNDGKRPKAGDAETTVSTHFHDDDKLYPQLTLKNERVDELLA